MKKFLILFFMFIICGCELINGIDETFITDYLNKKYGDDITFTPNYKSSCKVYETGKCRASYSASNLKDKEIQIIWTKEDGSDMKDDYLFQKYENTLNKYYSKLFQSSINGNYKLDILANQSDYNWDTNLKYEEFFKYENLNLAISINIANDNVDLSTLGNTLKTILKNNKISNVASLYLTNYNSGCNLNKLNSCKKVNSTYIEVKIVEFYDENTKKY